MSIIKAILFYHKNNLADGQGCNYYIIIHFDLFAVPNIEEQFAAIETLFVKYDIQHYTIIEEHFWTCKIIFDTREDYVYAKLALS